MVAFSSTNKKLLCDVPIVFELPETYNESTIVASPETYNVDTDNDLFMLIREPAIEDTEIPKFFTLLDEADAIIIETYKLFYRFNI